MEFSVDRIDILIVKLDQRSAVIESTDQKIYYNTVKIIRVKLNV